MFSSQSDKIKVLLIDDDPIALSVIQERLERAGYQVVVRTQALGTVQYVRSERPDFVLVDLQMPAISGASLASLIANNADTREVGVILHSSAPAREIASVVSQVGAIGGLSKSETSEGFIQRFNEFVEQHAVRTAPR